jgi:hypothetical protein
MTVEQAIEILRDTALLGVDQSAEEELRDAINVLDNADVFVGHDGEEV